MKRAPKDLDKHRPRKDGTPRTRKAEDRFSLQEVEGFGEADLLDEEAVFARQLAIAKERASKNSQAVPMCANEDFVLPFDFLDQVYIVDGKGEKKFLTMREKIAICEFTTCLNQSEAMKRAGYAESTYRNGNTNFFNRPLIQHAVKLAFRYRMEQIALSTERVFDELATIAFSDISDAVSIENGRLKINDSKDMSIRTRRAIQEITETRNNQGTTIKVRMFDKLGALAQLARSLGMNKDKVEVEINETAADIITAARERVINAKKAGEPVEEAEYREVRSDESNGSGEGAR